MRVYLFAVLAGLSIGCSTAPTAQRPRACDKTDRRGVYLLESTLISGSCGPLGTQLVNLDDPPPKDCKATGETWTESDCRVSGTLTCQTTRVVEITTQETQDGSVLDGTSTVEISGPGACTSTYNVRFTRQ